MKTPKKKQWIVYQGSNICYQVFKKNDNDKKPYLIFIHGFLSSQFSFRSMIPLLITDFNIITLDLPPFGDSDRIRNFNYSYVNLANIVIYFMNKHHIRRASLVGHSMGGQVALTCAYNHPDRIKHLFLLAPSSYMAKADLFSYLVSSLPFFPSFLKRMFYRKGVYQILDQCVYDKNKITKRMVATYRKPFKQNEMYLCLTKLIRDREGDMDRGCLQEIETKCVIFWGKQDEILPMSIGYRLLQDLPNAELCLFDHAGHLLPEEIPTVISKKIAFDAIVSKPNISNC